MDTETTITAPEAGDFDLLADAPDTPETPEDAADAGEVTAIPENDDHPWYQAPPEVPELTQPPEPRRIGPEELFAFAREHPEVPPEAIPREVWRAVARGETLTRAWEAAENMRLRARLFQLERQDLNRRRSAGSLTSAGKTKASDPFDVGWNDI